MYADDVVIYLPFSDCNVSIQLPKIHSALEDVTAWFHYNKLKLNGSKTEAIVFTKNTVINANAVAAVTRNIVVDGHRIKPTDAFKFLGVTLDPHLTLAKHVSEASRNLTWQLREIRRLRRRLDQNTAETVVRSFVMSRLDYCNAIYCNLPATRTQPLVRILNFAARTVASSQLYDHVTPVLMDLHWLPLRQRVIFKMSCTVFCCLNGTAPNYLADTITRRI